MRRMKFTPPTNDYNEEIKNIDEQICELIDRRKKVSDNNPGFPKMEYICNWAEKYNIYEDLLSSIFSMLYHENEYIPIVEPEEFRKNISILRSVEKDNKILSVTSMQQYNNASIINISIEWNSEGEEDYLNMHPEIYISEKYICRMDSGSGGDGHKYYRFIVTPALPDDVSGINLIYKEKNLETKEDSNILIEL